MFSSERWSRLGFRAVVAAFLTAAAYYLVFGGEFSVFDLKELQHEWSAASVRLDSIRHDVDSLSARADSLRSDSAAIERVAREEYGMIRDGELLFRFVGPDTATAVAGSKPGEPLP